MNYQKAYPFFEHLINKMLIKLHKRLEFENLRNNEKTFLIELIESLQHFKTQLEKKPSLSNANMEWVINEKYKEDPTVHGIVLYVWLKHNPQLGRLSKTDLNLAK